ncbi:MAG: Gfo/Idh/MocA family protein [Chloroflexota bacterium]
MPDKIRLAVAGLGFWGRRWVPYVLASPDCELVAAIDPLPAARAAAREAFDLPEEMTFADLASAAERARPDAVAIVVPPKYHVALARQALALGLQVLCEKPLAPTMPEARALLAEVERTGLTFMVSQNYRFRGANRAVKEAIAAGAIGEPAYIHWDFQRAMRFGGWRDEEMDEVVLEDMSIHHFDLMRFFTGREVVEVYARGFRPDFSWFKGRPCAAAVLRLEGDLYANYFGSWVAPGTQTTVNGKVKVAGSAGALEFDTDIADAVLVSEGGRARRTVKGGLDFPGLDRALAHFAHCLQSGQRPETDIRDNIKSLAVDLAALESSRTGQPVRVSDILEGRGAL